VYDGTFDNMKRYLLHVFPQIMEEKIDKLYQQPSIDGNVFVFLCSEGLYFAVVLSTCAILGVELARQRYPRSSLRTTRLYNEMLRIYDMAIRNQIGWVALALLISYMFQQRLRTTGAFEVELTDDGRIMDVNATPSAPTTAVLFSRLAQERVPSIREITIALAAKGLKCVGMSCGTKDAENRIEDLAQNLTR
jgi:hypothetical protein